MIILEIADALKNRIRARSWLFKVALRIKIMLSLRDMLGENSGGISKD